MAKMLAKRSPEDKPSKKNRLAPPNRTSAILSILVDGVAGSVMKETDISIKNLFEKV
jgi:hypothetical protein